MEKTRKVLSLNIVDQKNISIPLLGKFILISLIGGAAFGVSQGILLWLSRNGYLGVVKNYFFLRQLHAQSQIHIFFSTAICGFIIQAAPKLFTLPKILSHRIALCLAFCSIIGVSLKLLSGATSTFANIPLAIMPFCTGLLLVVRQKTKILRPHSVFVLTSLMSFVVLAFANYNTSYQILSLLWCSVGMAILGTSPLFAVNLLGGKSLSTPSFYLLYVISLCGGIGMYVGIIRESAMLLEVMILMFCIKIRIFSLYKGTSLLRFAFKLSFGWVLIAWILLIINPWRIDQAIHLVSLGWGVSILYALSLHITSVLSFNSPINTRMAVFFLFIWQFIPFTRGILFYHVQSIYTIILVSISLFAFWLYWTIAILIRTVK
jgi:hypothetical protein